MTARGAAPCAALPLPSRMPSPKFRSALACSTAAPCHFHKPYTIWYLTARNLYRQVWMMRAWDDARLQRQGAREQARERGRVGGRRLALAPPAAGDLHRADLDAGRQQHGPPGARALC